MLIEVTASTKWAGCLETLILDTKELGYSDEQWDNLTEEHREDEVIQAAYDAIGFSFNYDYID